MILDPGSIQYISSTRGITLAAVETWAIHSKSAREISLCLALFDCGVHEDKLSKALISGLTVTEVADLWMSLTPEQQAESYIKSIQGSELYV